MGACDGECVGMVAVVGSSVPAVGEDVGVEVGNPLGDAVGLPEGVVLGWVVGAAVFRQQLMYCFSTFGQHKPLVNPSKAHRWCREQSAVDVGLRVGEIEGPCVGARDGEGLGDVVGTSVGESVNPAALVGSLVLAVGADDGASLGSAVGLMVGDPDGSTLGWVLGAPVLRQQLMNVPCTFGQHKPLVNPSKAQR